jgi:hypothetical protein
MQRRIGFYFLLFNLFLSFLSLAQDEDKKDAVGGNNIIGLNIQKPFGEFCKTHRFGIGLTYSRGDRRTMRIKKVEPKKFLFTYQAGVTWYNGRREISYDYAYDHPSFMLIHVYGGLKYRAGANAELKLLVGPAMGIYDGDADFNLGADLIAGYFINDRLSINPGVGIQVEGGTAAKVVAKLGAQFLF